MNEWLPLLVAGTAALVVAAMGGFATEIGPWYRALRKPSFQPPDWAFGPAWTVIFGLAAVAGARAWEAAPDAATRTLVVVLFAVNGVLNVAWSLLFFRLRRPDWALIEVAALWLSILVLIVALWPFAPHGAQLLIPYLVWVSFAAVLNWATARLNRPFG